MAMRYWIAQYVPDPFRDEPMNIGIFVRDSEQMAARFLGESEFLEIDKRRLKKFQNPDVYIQWVEYWREQISSNDPGKIERKNGLNYRVLERGEVTDTANDLPQQVADYLFSMLVSKGGLSEVFQEDEEKEDKKVNFSEEISRLFKELDLIQDEPTLHVKYPIRTGVKVQGSKIMHSPSFVQENGHLCVMDLVDFTISKKKLSLDHAGFLGYMFRDIREKKRSAENYSIIRLRNEDEESKDVQFGIEMLRNEPDLINWLDDEQRSQFINDRRVTASLENSS